MGGGRGSVAGSIVAYAMGITEIDPLRALEAAMDGFSVMPMAQAARVGDIFVTATGDRDIIAGEHIKKMKNGAILANAGHFNNEINIADLERMTKKKRTSVRFFFM